MVRVLYRDLDIFKVGPRSREAFGRVNRKPFEFEIAQGAWQLRDAFRNISPVAATLPV